MREAFSANVMQQVAAMRRYARTLTRDDGAADDLVQQALLLAIERAESFRQGGSLKGWLLAIVHNQFVSGMRRAAVEKRGLDGLAAIPRDDMIGAGQEQAYHLQEVAERFAALPDTQRAVLHLIAIEGLSYRDAADALDIPIGTVMSRLARARAALRGAGDAERESREAGLRIVGGRDVE